MNPVLIFCFRVLEVIFGVGAVGSLVVLLLTAVEDLETLLGFGEQDHS